tara:strand:+ start:67 stop:870 length:804 start_codon:yes stop_codon:yes gene_type:complete
MSKKILIIWVLTLCFSCSPDSADEQLPEIEKKFDVNLTPSVTEITVDLPFEVKVQANEAIYEITRIFENGSQSITAGMPGTPLDEHKLNLHFQFGNLGKEEVKLEFTSVSGEKTTKILNFDVTRGNAVKLIGFRINSFYNMNGSWDEEYTGEDPNRLADIIFSLNKLKNFHFSNATVDMRLWYLSPIYPNLQQLEWDLSQQELYISDRSTIEFGIGDDDGNGIGQDLARNSQELIIRLNDYRNTKPTEINLSNEEYGYDVSFILEWL